ncbi:unnamed protein product [Paramecium sonneborni]|uniref:Uncharacterized protein n=1 Tax=Paramecium sonneborni TaxID=65129 RepID=A0A8S1Q0D2_9CILI|nr:unnamed protein product [Paramecium sonneborni]
MNHPKTYFQTPLSNLAKVTTNTQVDEWNEEDEVQTQNSTLFIIQSCLSKTIVEDFKIKPCCVRLKKRDWKDQFIWL